MWKVARNQAKAALAQVISIVRMFETARAQVQQAQTRLEQAQLNLSYTKVVAPRDGRVTRRTVELGAYLQTGQALLAVSAGRCLGGGQFQGNAVGIHAPRPAGDD